MRELPSKSLVPVSCRPVTSSLGQLDRSPQMDRPTKIAFGEMREMGVRGRLADRGLPLMGTDETEMKQAMK